MYMTATGVASVAHVAWDTADVQQDRCSILSICCCVWHCARVQRVCGLMVL